MKNQSWVISHSGRTFGKKPVLTAAIQLTPKDEDELKKKAYEEGFLDALNVEPPSVEDKDGKAA